MENHRHKKYKAFVAHSFDKEDEKVVNWIINKLKRYFDIVTGEQPEAKTLTEKIFPRINKCDVFCGIFTKRYHNDKGEWVASPWIYSETTYALSNKKKVLVFLEEGIKDTGIIPKDYEYVPFKRGEIENKKNIRKLNERIENYVNSAYMSLKKGGTESIYMVIENICRISVYNDDHGIEDVEVTLKTLSDNFEKRLHAFWLEDCASKDINLIPLREKLKNLDLSSASKKRFSEQTFYARVLEPESVRVSSNLDTDESEKDDKIPFNLIFKSLDGNQISAGTRIKYAWGWSSPNAFPFKKEQLSDGSLKKNVDYASYTWKTTSEYNFAIVVNFESGYSIKEGPFVEVFDREWQKIKRMDYPDIEKKLYYTAYYFNVGKVQSNHKFIVKWKPD